MNKKALYIGAGVLVLAGIGFIIWKNSKKEKPINEESLKALAKKVSPDAEKELDGYLNIIKAAKLSESDTQRVYNVLNGILLAKNDKKWDEKADIATRKKILLGYGVKEEDFKVFQDVIINKLANILTQALGIK